MLHLQLRPFSVFVFRHTVVLLLFTHSCGGQYQLVGPPQPIVALVGDDITLLRHTEPAVDASGMTVEWTRPDLNPRFVHVWRDGGELEDKKHPSYRGRTSLFVNELKHGDVSLKLDKVTRFDEGRYRCFIPGLNQASSVELVVGVVSSPVVEIRNSSRGVLHCESKGWYPEPEVSWLDGEGHVLSVGPTETVRGPDGLYTVSSRVTVEKRHSNNFSCRVQQKDINQIRETQIHVPDDFFEVRSSSAPLIGLTVGLSVFILVIVAAVFVLWKRRQKTNKTKTDHEDNKQDEEEKKNKPTDDPEHQNLMEGGGNAETTGMNGDKGVEKKTLSLSSNTKSLTAVKNTEGICLEEEGQKISQEENQSVQRRTNENERKQTETSEKQDGDKKLQSDSKHVKQMKDKYENPSQETKPKTEDRKFTKDKEMLNVSRPVSTIVGQHKAQSDESEEKLQTESQRPLEENKRSTDTRTVAHGHIMRS